LPTTIHLADYDPAWTERFDCEAGGIRRVLQDRALRVEHVGSTSVPGLPAKPVIDILLEVADSAREHDYAPLLATLGYRIYIREPEWFGHRLLKPPGNDVNLHVFSTGCPEIGRMLEFRNWLRANIHDRERYANHKKALARHEWQSVDDYANAKTAVITEILNRMRTG